MNNIFIDWDVLDDFEEDIDDSGVGPSGSSATASGGVGDVRSGEVMDGVDLAVGPDDLEYDEGHESDEFDMDVEEGEGNPADDDMDAEDGEGNPADDVIDDLEDFIQSGDENVDYDNVSDEDTDLRHISATGDSEAYEKISAWTIKRYLIGNTYNFLIFF